MSDQQPWDPGQPQGRQYPPQQQPYGQPSYGQQPYPQEQPQYGQQDPGQYPGQAPYQGQPYGPPGGQPPYPGPGYGPQPPGPQPPRRRRKRHLVRNTLAVIGGLVVALIAISAAASHGSGTPASSASSPAASSASSPAAVSSSPAAKPAKARTVATFSGSGQQNTSRFTVTSTWKLVYSFNCQAFGSQGNFQVFEDGGSDFNGASVNDLAMSKSSSTWAYGDAGTHYLEINSECAWKVKVVDEP